MLTRPVIGARMNVKSRCTRNSSSCAVLDSTAAVKMLTWVLALLSVTMVVAFLATSAS